VNSVQFFNVNVNPHKDDTLIRDYPGRPVPEETLTHSHPSWSSDILSQLPPFTTIHSILCIQFMCLTVLSDKPHGQLFFVAEN